jgi:large subunit ribosomal protein L22
MSQSVQAIAKGVRLSPRKMKPVASLVRGRTVVDALVILQHTPRRSAQPVAKVIASAKANAINNHGLLEQNLRIASIEVNYGPTLKRFRPVAHGSAHAIHKRTSHIKVVVVGDEKPKRSTAAKAAAKKETKE